MQIYPPNLKGPLKVSGFIDPDDVTEIRVFWNAPTFSPLTVYRQGDITRPTVDNGYYYQCSTNGVTAASEPSWGQEETTSGSAVFIAVPWNLWLVPSANIANSQWISSNNNITLANSMHTNYYSAVLISTVPANLTDFTLTNQVTNQNNEKLTRSFTYKVNQQ